MKINRFWDYFHKTEVVVLPSADMPSSILFSVLLGGFDLRKELNILLDLRSTGEDFGISEAKIPSRTAELDKPNIGVSVKSTPCLLAGFW